MREPSLVSVLHFMDKHGGTESLEILKTILDTKGLTAAAREFLVDKGWLSRFLRRNFRTVHVLHPDLRDALDHVETIRRQHYENARREEATVLRLVTAGKSRSSHGGS